MTSEATLVNVGNVKIGRDVDVVFFSLFSVLFNVEFFFHRSENAVMPRFTYVFN